MEKAYVVQMEAPLGLRHGKMYFWIDGQKVDGKFEILGSSNDFCGTLDRQGNLKIAGKLQSGTRQISYVWMGVMKDTIIEMELTENENRYPVKGCLYAFIQEEERKDEKIL